MLPHQGGNQSDSCNQRAPDLSRGRKITASVFQLSPDGSPELAQLYDQQLPAILPRHPGSNRRESPAAQRTTRKTLQLFR